MRKAQTFAKKITEWDLLNNNIKPHLAEMPYLQEIITGLEGLIGEARSIDAGQEVARGQLQDLIQKRREIEKKGEELRQRATSHLRGSLGFTSNDLVKFGVRPRRTGPRAKRTPPVVEPPAPATDRG